MAILSPDVSIIAFNVNVLTMPGKRQEWQSRRKSISKDKHTVWFHPYNTLEMTKKERWRIERWLPGMGAGEGVAVTYKGTCFSPCDEWFYIMTASSHVIKVHKIKYTLIHMNAQKTGKI